MNTFLPLVRRGGALLAALIFLLGLSACTSVRVTDDTTGEYRLNELRVMVDQSFESVYGAVQRALPKQGLFITGDEKQVVAGTITGRDREDRQVVVKVSEVQPGRTSVKIRYGLTGDLAQAQMLFAKIEQEL